MQENKKCCCDGECKKDPFIEKLISKYKPIKDNLIQMLNEIQDHYGYIPIDAQKELSEFLSLPMAVDNSPSKFAFSETLCVFAQEVLRAAIFSKVFCS